MASLSSCVQAGRDVLGELGVLAGARGRSIWVLSGCQAGSDAPVTPLFVLMANPSVPVSAALAESRFPDKSNNPTCPESRDYFLKCKRGAFAVTVVAKVHLPFLSPGQLLPACPVALVLSRWRRKHSSAAARGNIAQLTRKSPCFPDNGHDLFRRWGFLPCLWFCWTSCRGVLQACCAISAAFQPRVGRILH